MSINVFTYAEQCLMDLEGISTDVFGVINLNSVSALASR